VKGDFATKQLRGISLVSENDGRTPETAIADVSPEHTNVEVAISKRSTNKELGKKAVKTAISNKRAASIVDGSLTTKIQQSAAGAISKILLI